MFSKVRKKIETLHDTYVLSVAHKFRFNIPFFHKSHSNDIR